MRLSFMQIKLLGYEERYMFPILDIYWYWLTYNETGLSPMDAFAVLQLYLEQGERIPTPDYDFTNSVAEHYWRFAASCAYYLF